MSFPVKVLILVACVSVSGFVGYRIGFSRAPSVNCSIQVERELISNPAFRDYVTRVYGHVFEKELREYMMSPAMEKVVIEWLQKEAPFCRSLKVSKELKHNPVPTQQQFNEFFMKRRDK